MWKDLSFITITTRGAIRLAPHICVDGHDTHCRVRVVTHIHSDHLTDLEKSIIASNLVIATPITMDLLEILGYNIPQRKRIPLNYEIPLLLDNHKIELVYAHHIAGTAQVIVENPNIIAAYTSDFKQPQQRTPILRDVDVLVIDATYGDPRCSREDEETIIEKLVKLIQRLLTEKPVNIYAYYGKAQEIMLLLREYGIDAPFIASPRQWQVLKVLSKYGINVRDVYLNGTVDAMEIQRSGWYIAFHHHTRFYSMKNHRLAYLILLSGWLFNKPVRRLNENSWIVGFSDHADFEELLMYVDEARPRLLIVDGFRGGVTAYRFASHVERSLGIRSLVKP